MLDLPEAHAVYAAGTSGPAPIIVRHAGIRITSRSRNPSLSSAIRALGLAERAGGGVDRMYAEMARLGHEPPTFVGEDMRVAVTLTGGAPNAAAARFVDTLPADRRSDPDTLFVLLTLLTGRSVTAAALVSLPQKDVAELEVVLQQRAAAPAWLLERTRESASLQTGVYGCGELPWPAWALLSPTGAGREMRQNT